MFGQFPFAEKTVREIMTTDVVTLSVDDTLRMANDIMALANLRFFPVYQGERIVGVVSWVDLIRASLASAVRHGGEPLREALGAITIGDVTMGPPITVSPNLTMAAAARIMVEKRTDCLLVVERDCLIGLATRTDFLREMAKP
ncbi:MAG: CBS domain-containing protein [Deltaproteobacteria bacterium]|nr:CBS domain-containing protein [Deltaproteobacteria bacterium]